MPKKKILIISFSDLERDPRVSRQIEFLKEDYALTTIGYAPVTDTAIPHITIKPNPLTKAQKLKWVFWLSTRQFNRYYKSTHNFEKVLNELGDKTFDLVLANDIEALPLACWVKGNAKLLFDAHEYFPGQFEERWEWRLLFQPALMYQAKRYLSEVDLMMTVCDGLAKEYEKTFGLLPEIFTNATKYYDLQPSPMKEGKIRLVHHGNATPGRKIERMLEMMPHLDERFELTLILAAHSGVGKMTGRYIDFLHEEAKKYPKVKIQPPVPREEIPIATNAYDIGLFLLEPTNFNYRYALPNKLFEFVQARLAIAIGPSIEMQKVVEEYGLGVVSEDFSSERLAAKLNALTTEDIMEFKQKSNEHAKALSAEHNGEKLRNWVEELLD